MKTRNILFIFIGCLLFTLCFLSIPDATQAQQAKKYLPSFFVPEGAIVMWSGDPAAIPDGWQLCNGMFGTPDLRDRFILADSWQTGKVGGYDWLQLAMTNMPAHSHSLETNYAGAHQHTYEDYQRGITGLWFGFLYIADFAYPGDDFGYAYSSLDGAHKHSGITDYQGVNAWIDNRPSYYTLAFIMKL